MVPGTLLHVAWLVQLPSPQGLLWPSDSGASGLCVEHTDLSNSVPL